jgi:hypothetical protein
VQLRCSLLGVALWWPYAHQPTDTAIPLPGRHPLTSDQRCGNGVQVETLSHIIFPHFYFLSFFLSCEYDFPPPCILPSFPPHFRHRTMASSSNENISPLEALAPLHSLAQLVSSASPATASGSKDEGKYILLTSLKPDAWLVHVGRPDGRWWKGAWRVSDMEKLAVCAQSAFPPPVKSSCR